MKRFWDWLLNNIISILTIIFPFIGGSFATISGVMTGSLTWREIVLAGLLLAVIIVLVVHAVWDKKSYKSYRYPWSKIRTVYNYEVLEKTISYIRDANDVLHYGRSMTLKCHSNRLNYVFDKYIWTGTQSRLAAIIPEKGISSIRNKSKIGIWHYFVIEMQNHLKKGETREISYKWPDISDCSKSSPFFSASTDEPTKKLTLTLELGAKYANQEIICEEFRAIESDYPIFEKVEKLDKQGAYTWNIPNIKRFRHYRIRWSWSVGQPAAEIDE